MYKVLNRALIVQKRHSSATLSVPEQKMSPENYGIRADPLSQLMDEFRITALTMGITRAVPPWSLTARVDNPRIVMVVEGSMWASIETATEPLLLNAGDVLLLPPATLATLSDSLETPAAPLGIRRGVTLPVGVALPPNGTAWIGIGCVLNSTHPSFLSDLLPDFICLRHGTPSTAKWVDGTITLFEQEYEGNMPGRAAILERLAEGAFIRTIRAWSQQLPDTSTGWLRALKDTRIAAALTEIHAQPDHQWRVELLAKKVGMSRSAFALRFKSTVGESPMMYLARWRMQRATKLLDEERLSIKEVVKATGFTCATAFRRNFKRCTGMLPTEYVRKSRQG